MIFLKTENIFVASFTRRKNESCFLIRVNLMRAGMPEQRLRPAWIADPTVRYLFPPSPTSHIRFFGKKFVPFMLTYLHTPVAGECYQVVGF